MKKRNEDEAVKVKLKWKTFEGYREKSVSSLREDIEKDIVSHLSSHYTKHYEVQVTVTSLEYLKREGYVQVNMTFHDNPSERAEDFWESLLETTFEALKDMITKEIDADAEFLYFALPYVEDYYYDSDDLTEYFTPTVVRNDCHIEVVDVYFIPEFYGQQLLFE